MVMDFWGASVQELLVVAFFLTGMFMLYSSWKKQLLVHPLGTCSEKPQLSIIPEQKQIHTNLRFCRLVSRDSAGWSVWFIIEVPHVCPLSPAPQGSHTWDEVVPYSWLHVCSVNRFESFVRPHIGGSFFTKRNLSNSPPVGDFELENSLKKNRCAKLLHRLVTAYCSATPVWVLNIQWIQCSLDDKFLRLGSQQNYAVKIWVNQFGTQKKLEKCLKKQSWNVPQN